MADVDALRECLMRPKTSPQGLQCHVRAFFSLDPACVRPSLRLKVERQPCKCGKNCNKLKCSRKDAPFPQAPGAAARRDRPARPRASPQLLLPLSFFPKGFIRRLPAASPPTSIDHAPGQTSGISQ